MAARPSADDATTSGRTGTPGDTGAGSAGVGNTKVYIHELIDVIGHGRARYLHHMTANWCPIAREERDQLCFGVWATVGSTGAWPQTVNLWELDGWDGLVGNFEHELAGGRDQDPSLAAWWAEAAALRRGGFDRIVVPEPWTSPIEDLCAAGVRGELYTHELVTLPPGRAPAFLAAVGEEAVPTLGELGVGNVAAFRVAMVADDEAVLIWALPDWSTWAEVERAWLAGLGGDGPLAGWASTALGLGATWRRTCMVDAPLAPLRTGRQPQVEDRRPLEEIR
jgi:hypothetical protein